MVQLVVILYVVVMVQRYLSKSVSCVSTVLLCSTFLSLSAPGAAWAQSPSPQKSLITPSQQSALQAYRKYRKKKREASYKTRKQFPPQESTEVPMQMVQAGGHPNVVTRSSPAYEQLANSNLRPAKKKPQAVHNNEPLTPLAPTAESATAPTEPLILSPSPVEMAAPTPPASNTNQAVDDAYQRKLMEARELVPPTTPAEPVAMAEAPAAAPKPKRIVSPGIVIKRERIQMPLSPEVIASATPEQLAAFAPAAGEQPDGVSAPLIQIPDTTTNTPPPVPAAPPMPEPAPETVAEPPAPPAPPQPLAPAITPEVPTVEPTAPPKTIEPKISKPVTAPAVTPQQKAPELLPNAPDENNLIDLSEPAPELSRGSKRLIKRLPKMADEKRREPKGLDMNRAKDTSDALDMTVEHESEGVNIKVKAPSINISYELEKAYAALTNGNSMDAIAIYRRILANDANNVDALFGLATLYHRARQLDKARPLYGKVLTIDPDHREALNNFLVLLADEAPEAALEQLADLEKKNPSFSPIPAQMAVIYQKLGKVKEASDKMFKAVALAPENLTYRYNLAIMLDLRGNYEEARRLYQHLIQAHYRGESIPGNVAKVQERLTFLRSNNP